MIFWYGPHMPIWQNEYNPIAEINKSCRSLKSAIVLSTFSRCQGQNLMWLKLPLDMLSSPESELGSCLDLEDPPLQSTFEGARRAAISKWPHGHAEGSSAFVNSNPTRQRKEIKKWTDSNRWKRYNRGQSYARESTLTKGAPSSLQRRRAPQWR